MYITSWLLALQLIGTMSAAPSWNRDYGEALTRAGATKKPVAVFIASGKEGWKSVTTEGELGLEARRLLASHYICVYVDSAQAAQKGLVQSFDAGQQPLVVLSNHSGRYQAYRHSGKLANAGLAQALERHALEDRLEVFEPAPAVVDSIRFSAYALAPCRT